MFLLLTQQLFGFGAPSQKVGTRVVGSKNWAAAAGSIKSCSTMLAMQTANEYGLLDSVCAPYHHCAVCYHQQSSSSSSSSSCSWSWSSQGFSNRWVLDGGAPDTTIPSSRPWSWSASSKICVFYSHNNSLFLCQDHGHCQTDKWWGSSWQSSTILVLLGMKFFFFKTFGILQICYCCSIIVINPFAQIPE